MTIKHFYNEVLVKNKCSLKAHHLLFLLNPMYVDNLWL